MQNLLSIMCNTGRAAIRCWMHPATAGTATDALQTACDSQCQTWNHDQESLSLVAHSPSGHLHTVPAPLPDSPLQKVFNQLFSARNPPANLHRQAQAEGGRRKACAAEARLTALLEEALVRQRGISWTSLTRMLVVHLITRHSGIETWCAV